MKIMINDLDHLFINIILYIQYNVLMHASSVMLACLSDCLTHIVEMGSFVVQFCSRFLESCLWVDKCLHILL